MQFHFLEAFSFPINRLSYICFLLITLKIFDNSKIFAIFFAPCLAIDSRQKIFIMDMQLRQYFARAKPFRQKKKKKEKTDFDWNF